MGERARAARLNCTGAATAVRSRVRISDLPGSSPFVRTRASPSGRPASRRSATCCACSTSSRRFERRRRGRRFAASSTSSTEQADAGGGAPRRRVVEESSDGVRVMTVHTAKRPRVPGGGAVRSHRAPAASSGPRATSIPRASAVGAGAVRAPDPSSCLEQRDAVPRSTTRPRRCDSPIRWPPRAREPADRARCRQRQARWLGRHADARLALSAARVAHEAAQAGPAAQFGHDTVMERPSTRPPTTPTPSPSEHAPGG